MYFSIKVGQNRMLLLLLAYAAMLALIGIKESDCKTSAFKSSCSQYNLCFCCYYWFIILLFHVLWNPWSFWKWTLLIYKLYIESQGWPTASGWKDGSGGEALQAEQYFFASCRIISFHPAELFPSWTDILLQWHSRTWHYLKLDNLCQIVQREIVAIVLNQKWWFLWYEWNIIGWCLLL